MSNFAFSNTLSRRTLLAFAAAAPFIYTALAEKPAGRDQIAKALANGRKFLVDLFDPELQLLPEYSGAKIYWLFHDNYLAAHVLQETDKDLAARIRASLARYKVDRSGKIEIVTGEAKDPLPFREFDLQTVAVEGKKIIKTERLTDRPLRGWKEYADLLFMAAIAQAPSATADAKELYENAWKKWDGKGFADPASGREKRPYATYKLALALLAGRALSAKHANNEKLVERLLAQQNQSGGWITDYDANLKPVGLANVETTSLAMMALKSPD